MGLRVSKHGREPLGAHERFVSKHTALCRTYSMSHEALSNVIFAYSLKAKLQYRELSPSPTDLISVILHVYSSPALLLRFLTCAIARALLRATVI
jgi:hypothetical protein